MAKKLNKSGERTARPQTPGLNLLYPINLDKIGTEDDPCFGKQHDPKNEVCSRCGDCELCQIVFSNNMHKTRAKTESTQAYMDMDEKEVYDSIAKKDKEVKAGIRTIIRKNKKIDRAELIKRVQAQYNLSPNKAEKIYKSLLKTTTKFKETKNQVIWNN